MIVPAQPDDPDATRGIRFRSAVAFTEAELLSLNALYKSRWPSMENELKALQSQGFGRNRTRRLELVVSRGTDGEVARLRAREERWRGKVRELEAEPLSGKAVGRLIAAAGKVEQARARQAAVVAAAPLKHARVEGGAERLGKWLLVHNAMARALATSPDEDVRVMAPTTVGELLLGQSALTVVETERLTMWVDALDAAEDRRRQAALVEVFNSLGLRCRGSAGVIHLRQRPAGMGS
ncbi:MAG: hypothetical protein Q8S73_28780 [Deltaproteobacteria bacterium]|nr:hypothetical protein [Deltaproteobacteria bacterium]